MRDVAKIVRPRHCSEKFDLENRQGDVAWIPHGDDEAGVGVKIGDQTAMFKIEEILVDDDTRAARCVAIGFRIAVAKIPRGFAGRTPVRLNDAGY